VRELLDELRTDHARNFGWSLSCCGWQRELAEDVLQEAYLRVLDGSARFRGRSSPRTWFYAVIRQVARDSLRGQHRRAVLNLRAVGREEPEPVGDGAMERLQEDENCGRLRAALMAISERQREVLHLVFYAELTVEEAAQTLRISVGSARTHYHRGKERLAQLLELDDDD